MTPEQQLQEYGVCEGSTVSHVKEPEITGTVLAIDCNLDSWTTCSVKWEDKDLPSIEWTNKLVRI